MTKSVFTLILVVLAVVVASPASGWAQELGEQEAVVTPASEHVCSLDWELFEDSVLGWVPVGKPNIDTDDNGVPKYVYQLLAEVIEHGKVARIVLVVAEFGEMMKTGEVGDLVYCYCMGPGGVTLEEVGENPLEKPRPVAAQRIRL